MKRVLRILLLISLLACEYSPRFILESTQRREAYVRLGNLELVIGGQTYFGNISVNLSLKSSGVSYLHPRNLGIIIRSKTLPADHPGWLIPYEIYDEKGAITSDSLVVSGSDKALIFYSTRGHLEKGDLVKIFALDYVSDGTRYYNLDTLRFVIP